MNVFILCTGRCGSAAIIKACHEIKNFSADHESLSKETGEARLAYPANHIEADNRLSWFLGRLDNTYGNEAYYIHLTRDKNATAQSLNKRWYKYGIIPAYARGILKSDRTDLDIALDYIDTINSNISHFLKDKTHVKHMSLEHIKSDFKEMWDWIGAEGDLQAALASFDKPENSSKTNFSLRNQINMAIFAIKQMFR